VFSILSAACEDEPIQPSASARPPTAEDQPLVVEVSGDTVTEGFATGTMRRSRNVTSFRITRHAITVAQYRRCVASGACSTPGVTCLDTGSGPLEGPNFTRSVADDVPVTCVGTAAAQAYCGWLSGALPKLSEWMLAARGSQVQRFPWGNRAASCAEHPLGFAVASTTCDAENPSFQVGKHSPGAAASGMEDVLLTRGELTAVQEDATFGACAPPSLGCVVSGIHPGAMDSVEPILRDATGNEFAHSAYGFRCVWSMQ
jgi:hypothetical protein